MKKLKIALFTDNFFPEVNGVVSAINSSTKGLLKLGHEVLIFAPKSPLLNSKQQMQYSDLNVKIVYLPSVPAMLYPGLRFSFPFFPMTIIKILKFKPDIIHFHTPLTVGMEAILVAKSIEKPLIGTFHTFFMEEEYLKKMKFSKIHAEKVFNKLGWEYSNFFYNQTDVIISPSKYTAENLLSNGCIKKVVTIANSIEISDNVSLLSVGEREKLKKSFGIPDENKVIIWLGRLSPEKNLDIALKAFGILRKKIEKVSFLLIGDGPEKNNLKRIIRNEKLSKDVIFAGVIDHHLLLKKHILQIGDLFFSASTSENQPISALEAMSEGLPLVVTNKRGMPELIEGNGYICKSDDIQEMADKIYILLTDKDQRDKMAKMSSKMSKKYSSEIISKKLEQLYLDQLEKREYKVV